MIFGIEKIEKNEHWSFFWSIYSIRKKYEFRIENRFIHHKMMIAIIFIFDNLRTQGVL